MCWADEPGCRRPALYPTPPDLGHLPEPEAHPVYRATFLALYPPEQAAALEEAAREAFYRAIEARPAGSASTEGELRAAARELEVVASYLAGLAEQRFRSGLDERDARLAQWAEDLAVETDALARRIRGEVGEDGEDERGGAGRAPAETPEGLVPPPAPETG